MDRTLLSALALVLLASNAAGDEYNTIVYGLNKLTALSLQPSGRVCNVSDYPLDVFYNGALAFLPEEQLLVNCGGLLSDSVDYTTSCYAYDGSEWADFPSLPSDAKIAGTDVHSLLVPEFGWWLVDTGTSHTYLYANGAWAPGPELIHDYDYSCVLQLNATHSMLTGGVDVVAESWLFDWTSMVWTQVEDLQNARGKHVCAGVGNNVAMVVGGEGAHYSTELYENGSWQNGGEAPGSVDWFGRLNAWEGSEISGGPLLFTGSDNSLYYYKSDQWFNYAPGLNFNHEDNAVMIPDGFLQNCNV